MRANCSSISLYPFTFYIRLAAPGGKMKFTMFIISAICTLTFCVGCSTAQPPASASPVLPTNTPAARPETPVPPAAAPTETLIEFPSGKFYNGAFDSYLVINENGTWRLLEGTNRTFFTGSYRLEDERVFFADSSGYCSEYGDGIYSWDYQQGVLQVTIVQDECELRTARITLRYTQQ
jgi:hypothetical protein